MINQSYLNGNIEDAVDLLARTAINAREKRADESWIQTQLNNAADTLRERVVKPIAGEYTAPAMKHLGWTLAGGGIGGLLGAGSQMFAPPKKRKTLSSALTGGLLGAGAGLGGSLLHSYLPKLGDIDKDTPEARAAKVRDLQEKLKAQRAGTTNEDMELLGRQYGIPPGDIQHLALQSQYFNRDQAYKEYLSEAQNKNRAITLPEGTPPAIASALQTLPQYKLAPYGFKPEDIAGIKPDDTKGQQDFFNKVLGSYADPAKPSPYMRRVTTEDRSSYEPWTKEELAKLKWEDLHRAATEYPTHYPYTQEGEGRQNKLRQVHDQMVNKMTDAGGVNPISRRLTNLGGAVDRAVEKKNPLELDPGIGNYFTRGSGGLWKNIAGQGGKTDITPEQFAKAEEFLRSSGTDFKPLELLEPNRQGPEGIDRLSKVILAQGRTRMVKGQPVKWDEDSLKKELPGLITGVRKETGLAPGWMEGLPTSGNVAADLAAIPAAYDLIQSMRSMYSGNPVFIEDAIKAGKFPAHVTEPAKAYINAVYDREGMAGINKLLSGKRPELPGVNVTGNDLNSLIDQVKTKVTSELGTAKPPPPAYTVQSLRQAIDMAKPTTMGGQGIGGLDPAHIAELEKQLATIETMTDPAQQQNAVNQLIETSKQKQMTAPDIKWFKGELNRINKITNPVQRNYELNQLAQDAKNKQVVRRFDISALAENQTPAVPAEFNPRDPYMGVGNKWGISPRALNEMQALLSGKAHGLEPSVAKYLANNPEALARLMISPDEVMHIPGERPIIGSSVMKSLSNAGAAERGWISRFLGKGTYAGGRGTFPGGKLPGTARGGVYLAPAIIAQIIMGGNPSLRQMAEINEAKK